ncbi:unnamed protein product [Rotaria magnacalcarata]|uniref:F-box domain-containing protein n=3 Tax=Rotaria magnacalcarata TaxID=392030 RepID=A0A816B196_9BILA|nr:unnamed protein product [Rotaria magnacalcarata]
MNERQFHFQDLPVERFRRIFKYLAPHDLVNPFERLNQQFDIMFAQQPLCLPNNRQMSIHGIVGENISHLLRIAQRSPYFSELYIESDLDYGRVLSLNRQLGSLLCRQLVILHFTTKEANSSLGDLVRIIDKLDVGEL